MKIEIKKLIYSDRKGFRLRIDEKGDLIVFAPYNATKNDVLQIVEKKMNWIVRTRERILENLKKIKQNNFEEGEEFLFLGRTYKLAFWLKSGIELDEKNRKIYVPFADKTTVQRKMLNFYKSNAKSYLQSVLDKCSENMNIKYKKFQIRDSKTVWGSCGKNGSINLNWRLILLPEEIIEHIIIHELAHVVYRNHSKQFYNFVSLFSKDYKEKDRWLRDNSYILNLFR